MLRNINEKLFKKLPRIKLVAIGTVIMVTISSVMLFGCSKIDEDPIDDKNDEPVSEKIEDNELFYHEGQNNTNNAPVVKNDNISEFTIDLNKSFSFSSMKSDLNSYLDYIEGMNTTYKYSKYYNVQQALKMYNSTKEYQSPSSSKYIDRVTNKINSDELRKTVLANNKAFVEKYNNSRYTELSVTDFDLAFKAVVGGLNNRLATGLVDLNQLDYNLSRLKIIKTTDYEFGGLRDEDVLLSLNIKIIDTAGNHIDVLKEVATHEGEHLAGLSSDIEKKNEGYDRSNGISYNWKSLDVNPLDVSWYNEGAAERLARIDQKSTFKNTNYDNMVFAVDSLALSSLLKSNTTANAIPDLSAQSSWEPLFSLFNANTDKEKEEVVNMMYSYEIVLRQDKEFYAKAGNLNRHEVQVSLEASIAQTLSKNFYYNLACKLSDESVSIDDLFNLLAVQEADMNRVTKYYNRTDDETKVFLDEYYKMQKNFFEMVSKATNISLDTLYSNYDLYINKNIELKNVSQLLSSDKEDYVSIVIQNGKIVKTIDNLFKYRR